MGEVYRARDEKLNRDVAIKVLPVSFAENHDRLLRFEQEAQAAGTLSHPNILAVYDLGMHDGAPYVVSELLEGESFRDLLTHRMETVSLPGCSMRTAARVDVCYTISREERHPD